MTREVELRQKDWKHCPVYGPQLKDWHIGRRLAQATRGRITSHGQESPAAIRAMKEGYAVATTFDEIWPDPPWTKGTKRRATRKTY